MMCCHHAIPMHTCTCVQTHILIRKHFCDMDMCICIRIESTHICIHREDMHYLFISMLCLTIPWCSLVMLSSCHVFQLSRFSSSCLPCDQNAEKQFLLTRSSDTQKGPQSVGNASPNPRIGSNCGVKSDLESVTIGFYHDINVFGWLLDQQMVMKRFPWSSFRIKLGRQK